MKVEPLEPVAPDLAVLSDPLRGMFEGCRLEPARTPLGVASSRDEPGPLENLQVLGDGLEAHGKRLGELVDGRFAFRQPGEDRSAGRVGESGKRAAELVGGGRIQPPG